MSALSIEQIPEEISKELGPYFKRAIELEEFKPIVSYYCKFYLTERIIDKKLHLESPDIANFTALLLDNMEQCKAKLSEEDMKIMQDSTASYEHVKEFAFSIFHKGYLDIVNHTTTKGTIGVLKNAIEFMTVLKYWGEPLAADVLKNVKYSKFHISRILKDYKTRKDPNDYMTPEDKDIEQNLDETLEQEHLKQDTSSPSKDIDLPQPPATIDDNEAFPSPPTFINNDSTSELPQPPSFINEASPPPLPPASPSHSSQDVHQKPPSPSLSTVIPKSQAQPTAAKPKKLHMTQTDITEMLSREEKISKTQKLCKFAISALNYEDIDTAVLELRKALELLESES